MLSRTLSNILRTSKMSFTSCIPKRYIFAIMGFFATLIGYMLRISVELTISHMVMNETITTEPALYDPDSCPDQNINTNNSGIVVPNITVTKGSFDWDEKSQGSIISAYHSSYIMTQFIGGMYADINGGKSILANGMLASSLAAIVLPLTAQFFGSTGTLILRYIAGMTGGIIIPVLLSMMSKWVPADERAFVASIIFPGALIGKVAASYIAHPLILLAGWQSVYYTFGVIGVLWVIVWRFSCYDNPNTHPSISESERVYLNKTSEALARTTKHDLEPLPWKAFMRCLPYWTACVIGYTGREWALATLTILVPQLMKDVLRLDISDTHLSYQPYLCMWIFALMSGFISDILVIRRDYSLVFVRRLTTSIASIGSAICILVIMYSGCNAALATTFMFVGITLLGAYYSGVMINMLDLNPNYAGTMIGVADNIAINSVYLLTSLNSLVVSNALLSQWKITLWVAICVVIFSLGVFVFFVKTDQMWWDDVKKNGYPTNWKHGLFPAEALIGRSGETVSKPRKGFEMTEEKVLREEYL